VIQRTWVMAAGFAFKIAAKPLQIETWLLLTAYKNLSWLYPTVPSPTPYDVPFRHNTDVTDDRQTDDIFYPRLDLAVGKKRLKRECL